MWPPIVDLFSTRGRLVDANRNNGTTGHRRLGDGNLVAGEADALLHHSDRDNYLAFIKLASIRIWLRANESEL